VHCALPDSDLIVSDITSGLVLLRRFQRLQQKLLVSEVVSSVVQFSTLPQPRLIAVLLNAVVLALPSCFVMFIGLNYGASVYSVCVNL